MPFQGPGLEQRALEQYKCLSLAPLLAHHQPLEWWFLSGRTRRAFGLFSVIKTGGTSGCERTNHRLRVRRLRTRGGGMTLETDQYVVDYNVR